MRIAILALLAACGAAAPDPAPWRPAPAYHVTAAADVRWPVERTLFVGTVRGGMLQLDDSPRRIAVAAPDGRLAVSGIGRAVTHDEAAAGAVFALADVAIERDITAPHLATYPVMRRDGDLSVALAQTRISAEGTVRQHGARFFLELPTHERLELLVTACAGEADARAQLGQQRRVEGMLTEVDTRLAIGAPAFSSLRSSR